MVDYKRGRDGLVVRWFLDSRLSRDFELGVGAFAASALLLLYRL